MEASGQFACPQCGRSYKWKPEFAGKRVKCKCGNALAVPAQAGAAAAPKVLAAAAPVQAAPTAQDEAADEGLFDLKPRPEAQLPPPIAGPLPVAAVAGAGAASVGRPGRVIGYATPAAATKRGREPDKIIDFRRDYLIPLILLCAGFMASYFEATYGRGFSNGAAAALFVVFAALIDIALVFAGIMLAVKLLDLGLGPVGPAMLKIAGIAILPGAIAGVLAGIIHMPLVGWIVGILLTLGMYMLLLDLDGKETILCTALVIVTRQWIGMILVLALLNGFGFAAHLAPAAPSRGLGGSLFAQENETSIKDARAKRLFETQGRNIDGKDFMNRPVCVIDGCVDHPASQAFLQKLYDMGAPAIAITEFTWSESSQQSYAGEFVIQMPTDKAARKRIIEWYNSYHRPLGGEREEYDRGQTHFLVNPG